MTGTETDTAGEGWIFAYGSLMWDPGVPVAETVPARLPGWRRSFCLRSVMHRGTAESPGLVLGLDHAPEAECPGLALRVAPDDWPAAIASVRARELVTSAYREVLLPVRLQDGRQVAALTYVIRTDHPQYAGGLCLSEQAAIIAGAVGGRGPNLDYLVSFLGHLDELGMPAEDFRELGRLATAALSQKMYQAQPTVALGTRGDDP